MSRKMRFIGLMFSISVFAFACGDQTGETLSDGSVPNIDGSSPPQPDGTVGTATPLYVTIYSHNEDSWGPIVGDLARYSDYRADLKARLDIVASFGAKLNWQTDLPVLQAMQKHETDTGLLAKTGGITIIEYMEKLGFGVDPHLHRNSYADLAHIIELLGGSKAEVIGGVRFRECGQTETFSLMDWHKEIGMVNGEIKGKLYPDVVWKPTILSVPGFGGHWFDELSSGVWRPGARDDFFQDQGDGNIIYIGQGYPHDQANLGASHSSGNTPVHAKDGAYIKELLGKISSGELPAGRMYTASIHVRDQVSLKQKTGGPDVIVNDGLTQILKELEPYQKSGKIVYVTYQEAAQIWKTTYGSQVNQVSIEDFSMYSDILASAEGYCATN
jgi:hypothetical protein